MSIECMRAYNQLDNPKETEEEEEKTNQNNRRKEATTKRKIKKNMK